MKKQIFFFLLLLTACTNPETKKLEGIWTIDSITEYNNDIMFDFTSNVITFNANHKCILPKINNNDNVKPTGKWSLYPENNSYYIDIKAENHKLSNKYIIKFQNDPQNKLLKLYLYSENIKIVCSKLLNTYKEE